MKLLILTQYFPPETGAPQNRLFELAVRLQRLGTSVTVLTAMPNYPGMVIHEGYRGLSYHFETMNGLPVHRTSIYVSTRRNIVARLRNYFSFVWSSMRASGRLEAHYDYLLCESPPLFLGWSALYLCRKKNARLIFNVSDLWPESAEKLGVVTNPLLLGLAYRLEKRLYRKSTLVTGQTKGICSNISQRFPDVRTYWLPNGADLHFFSRENVDGSAWRKANRIAENEFVCLYAGIIGLAQGLEVILQAAALLKDEPRLKFAIAGDGPEKEKLVALAKAGNLNNVIFPDPVKKDGMPGMLAGSDAAVIPLKKLPIFLGAIPSKIFEALAMELPVILGVDGEARGLFIDEGQCGLYAEPENAGSLASAVRKLLHDEALCRQLGANGRRFVMKHFDRDSIAAGLQARLSALDASSARS